MSSYTLQPVGFIRSTLKWREEPNKKLKADALRARYRFRLRARLRRDKVIVSGYWDGPRYPGLIGRTREAA
ncbi:MAG: hypothetical protein QOH39_5 [Verrucomicrobiota bacterium]